MCLRNSNRSACSILVLCFVFCLRQEIPHIAEDPSVAFPTKVFRLLGPNNVRRHDAWSRPLTRRMRRMRTDRYTTRGQRKSSFAWCLVGQVGTRLSIWKPLLELENYTLTIYVICLVTYTPWTHHGDVEFGIGQKEHPGTGPCGPSTDQESPPVGVYAPDVV